MNLILSNANIPKCYALDSDCYSYEMADQCEAVNGTFYLRTCYNSTFSESQNLTELAIHVLKRPPAEEYFTNFVLGLSSGIEETGGIRLSLAICLLVAWIIVFLCLCKGVQSSGKVVYFTALFPYVVLVILFFRGVTLPGAKTGILFYLTPDWKQLANAQVWGDAAVQIFFALSPAWGGLITLSSYNKFTNNCYKDSLIVAVSNIATSFFAGLVIFSIIGFLAHELDVEVKKVVDQGAGLAFIVYPEVVTRLPVSPVWSVLFFVMLLTLGLDSQFALMETVTTAILDKFPALRQYKFWVVLAVSIFGYVGGLGFTTNSGMYWLQLMDKYAANWSVLLIAISECILIAWMYGSERFLNDIQSMIGRRSKFWIFFWSWMWRFITPATLLFILFFNWVEYKPASYGHYVYPFWADAVGWIIGLLPVSIIFLTATQQTLQAPKNLTFMEKVRTLLRPTAEWGPAGRPCCIIPSNSKQQHESNRYDSVATGRILTNGVPSDSPTHGGGGNAYGEYELAPIVVVTGAQIESQSMSSRCPGPSILKNPKNGKYANTSSSSSAKQKHPSADYSPSKQPLIGPELRHNDSVGSLSNRNLVLPATASSSLSSTSVTLGEKVDLTAASSVTTRVTASIKQPESYLSSTAIVTTKTANTTASTTGNDGQGRTLSTFVGTGGTNASAECRTFTTQNNKTKNNDKNSKAKGQE
ncbi:unnamed protein product [Hermetia illucens]|uniref:Uncharacterized protein n=1 Tax=Hermetia illucens TaxID=343691 RepID=A0A7R8YW15_HERIL|nr:unnamed protein product [Hermetia illucens]